MGGLFLLAALAVAGCSETKATRDPASTPVTSTAGPQGAMAKPPTTAASASPSGASARPQGTPTPEPINPPPT
jgi:hypothetical protein